MKKLLALGLLSVSLLTGCNDPIQGWQDKYTPPQVSLADYNSQWKLRFQPPTTERAPGGQLKVNLPVYNTTGDDLTVDYRYTFTDKNGAQIEDASMAGWHEVRLPPRGYQNVTFLSMTPAADNFHVQLREGKK